jgi:acetyl esterase/lipase
MLSLIFFLVCSLTFNAFSQDPVSYAFKDIDGVKLTLDVFKPAILKGKSPVIIMFHGGGLINGDRKQMYPQCRFFAERGFVAITADYRLLKDNSIPAEVNVPNCIKDVKSAVRWVKQHATELNIDTTKVILGGGSSGGFLATEAALNNDINETTDDRKISTKALLLILYNPAYTPSRRYAPTPVQYVNAKTPPTIMFFGDKDPYKPGGDEFYAALKKANVKTELWVAKDQTHSFFNKEIWQRATSGMTFNFLLSTGLVKGIPAPTMADAPLTLQ